MKSKARKKARKKGAKKGAKRRREKKARKKGAKKRREKKARKKARGAKKRREARRKGARREGKARGAKKRREARRLDYLTFVGLAMTISSNQYLLIQLRFTLNIIVYYSLHSCCFLKRKLKDVLLSFKNDYLATLALFIAKFSVMLRECKMFQN